MLAGLISLWIILVNVTVKMRIISTLDLDMARSIPSGVHVIESSEAAEGGVAQDVLGYRALAVQEVLHAAELHELGHDADCPLGRPEVCAVEAHKERTVLVRGTPIYSVCRTAERRDVVVQRVQLVLNHASLSIFVDGHVLDCHQLKGRHVHPEVDDSSSTSPEFLDALGTASKLGRSVLYDDMELGRFW